MQSCKVHAPQIFEDHPVAMLTVRNLPDEVHRALQARAARLGKSMEAEARDILESALRPNSRFKLGSVLAAVGREVRLTEDEFAVFSGVRDKTPARPVDFE
jgi:antitoxin FitA